MSAERATTLRLIKSIGFTDSYDDVILFNSTSQQYSYFASLPSKSYAEYSYQRPEAGYVKVSTPYDEIYDYAYLMFKNTSHQNKWWYAFIDSVEYINEKTTGVRFHIDVMQSYMFNYSLGESFVVREHSATDKPGDNIIPEHLFYGEYEFNEHIQQVTVKPQDTPFGDYLLSSIGASDMCLVVAYNPAIIDLIADGGFKWKEAMYGGVYQGIRFVCYPLCQQMGDVSDIIGTLDTFFGTSDILSSGIVNIFLMPIMFIPENKANTWFNKTHSVSYDPPTKFGDFSPKNKKLLTYPYVAINASNMRNPGVDYAYEYFTNRRAVFDYQGTFSANPSSICYPVGYKGKDYAVEDGVAMESYPVLPWGQSGFSEWCSNNLFQTAMSIGAAAATSGASAYASAMQNPVGAIQATNPGMTRKDAMAIARSAPDTTKAVTKSYANSRAASASTNSAIRAAVGEIPTAANFPGSVANVNAHDLLFGHWSGAQIFIRRKSISEHYARVIDDYFTRYGYATNEMKTPNLKSRPYFNHIQLKNPHFNNITCPMDVISDITSVYEKGVTFWRASATIGDYTNQDNSL